MSTIPAQHPPRFTYADYILWSGGDRWELIDGEAYMMTPAPNVAHQRLLLKLSLQVANWLEGKECEPFFAPIDVRFSQQKNAGDEEIDTVVQPDLVVVCDR